MLDMSSTPDTISGLKSLIRHQLRYYLQSHFRPVISTVYSYCKYFFYLRADYNDASSGFGLWAKTLRGQQHNYVTYATYFSSTARLYQFTPLSNLISESQNKENMPGIYASCFFSFRVFVFFIFIYRELGSSCQEPITIEATEAPTFLKRL